MRSSHSPANDNLFALHDASTELLAHEIHGLVAVTALAVAGLLSFLLYCFCHETAPCAPPPSGCRTIADIVDRDDCARTALRERLIMNDGRRLERRREVRCGTA